MGRGRAKAKQVKVARQLKYNSGGTDLERLREELGVGRSKHDDAYEADYEADDDLIARYADYADKYGEDDDRDDDRDGGKRRRS
ncbi:DUF3073 domain-containing protein [Thermostaphylospora chromogena]|uniref:DUF3073 domain-containing protein n=1 Tax=Thermostaphylospora chromogena TaxID=35622 RepID=A0A1H1BSY4_9ACTN|nr:DUF3073 domain-containing protein [Thermostaphylospora chromogena]SDQ55013.1 Protein of unknown function [Thermostaphylospora chromogena]